MQFVFGAHPLSAIRCIRVTGVVVTVTSPAGGGLDRGPSCCLGMDSKGRDSGTGDVGRAGSLASAPAALGVPDDRAPSTPRPLPPPRAYQEIPESPRADALTASDLATGPLTHELSSIITLKRRLYQISAARDGENRERSRQLTAIQRLATRTTEQLTTRCRDAEARVLAAEEASRRATADLKAATARSQTLDAANRRLQLAAAREASQRGQAEARAREAALELESQLRELTQHRARLDSVEQASLAAERSAADARSEAKAQTARAEAAESERDRLATEKASAAGALAAARARLEEREKRIESLERAQAQAAKKAAELAGRCSTLEAKLAKESAAASEAEARRAREAEEHGEALARRLADQRTALSVEARRREESLRATLEARAQGQIDAALRAEVERARALDATAQRLRAERDVLEARLQQETALVQERSQAVASQALRLVEAETRASEDQDEMQAALDAAEASRKLEIAKLIKKADARVAAARVEVRDMRTALRAARAELKRRRSAANSAATENQQELRAMRVRVEVAVRTAEESRARVAELQKALGESEERADAAEARLEEERQVFREHLDMLSVKISQQLDKRRSRRGRAVGADIGNES